MRAITAAALVVLSGTLAFAEPDQGLMDLSQGLWVLGSATGEGCPLTLGDELVDHGGRRLDGAGDCRSIDPAIASATGWRIDTPGDLVFLNGGGKVLLRMKYDEQNVTFVTESGRNPQLDLTPAQ